MPTSSGARTGQPREIAARPRKAGDEPARQPDRQQRRQWGGSWSLAWRPGRGCACGHDDINLERNQFGRESGEPLDLPLGISVFNHEVAALDVAEVTQSLDGRPRARGG